MSSRPTKTLIGEKAQKKILEGINAILIPTRLTFGPQGKNALIYRTLNRGPRITNDGVTVAEIQEPKDPFVNLVAETFKETCNKTNEKEGDGTTLTAILGGVLFNEIYRRQSENGGGISTSKVGVQTLKNEILESAKKVKEEIKKSAKTVKSLEELKKIASVSVQDKELGDIIAEMAWKVGVDGFIDTVEGYKGKIETEVIEGMKFPARAAGGGAFLTNPKKYEMVAEECPIIITNFKLDNVAQVTKVIGEMLKENKKLIIVAPSFSSNVLQLLLNTIIRKDKSGKVVASGVNIYPVQTPSLRTEQFKDLATYCDARFIDKETGAKFQNTTPNSLGFLDKIVVKTVEVGEEAMAIGGAGTKLSNTDKKDGDESDKTPIELRIEDLKGQLEEQKDERFKKLMERRIASMSSAVGIIKVGASTQANSLYNKHKIEDAVFACKSALKGGYVKGAGLCLKEISDKMKEDDILKSVLLAPWQQIQDSFDGELKIGDDIIDPANVVESAIEHATEVVAQLSTCDILTVEMEDPIPEEGNKMIAKVMMDAHILNLRASGIARENEEEILKDSMGGLTDDESIYFQNQQN